VGNFLEAWNTPITADPLLINQTFNLDTIFDDGFQIRQLPKDLADFYLRCVQRDTYVDDPFEGFENASYKEKYIRNRQFSQWALDGKPPEIYQELGDAFQALAQPLMRLYQHGRDVTQNQITLMKAKPGYCMGWHEDIADNSSFIGFVYLVPEALTAEDGGQLEIARVRRDDQGGVADRETIACITPTNGMLILMENQTTRFHHRVLHHNTHKERFLITINMGSNGE
jgi:hypothetical protein